MRLREEVSATDTEYGTVLLDERSGRYYQLSATAKAVVTSLGADGSVEAAVASLTGRFAVDESTAQRDVRALIERLRAAGLVTE
ncbi:hypothetical protein GCM10022222_55240 [Amycolatopsis ultiminotia]|uniref:Coenzyme PQQ synthesis protein D (PqqD) n=1 Tax=Amycolatopsis ultiminotia TaxID=543629 RepID=A0ABP6XC27_9PSEU